jgi:hypothetical protein
MSDHGAFSVAAATLTRPANTTAYAAGGLLANNTVAGSVVPIAFPNLAVAPGDAIAVTGARVRKSATSLTNAQVRLHLFSVQPTPSVGDGAAFNSSGALGLAGLTGYLGYMDITFDTSATAGASGRGVPTNPAVDKIITAPPSGGLWGLLEARGAYTPGNAETFDVSIEGLR